MKLRILLAVFVLTTSTTYSFAEETSASENSLGITSLMTAVTDDDLDGVKFFSKIDQSKINDTNIAGSTALNIASRKNNSEIIAALLENGANPNIADNEGWTALMRSARAGNSDAVNMLLAHGAKSQNINGIGETALVHSAHSQCLDCFAAILSDLNKNNINPALVRSQLSEAFEISRKLKNQEIQNFITNNSSQTQENQHTNQPVYSLKEPEQVTTQKEERVIFKTKEPVKPQATKYYNFTPAQEEIPQEKFKIIDSPSLSKNSYNDITEERISDNEVIFKFNEGAKPKKRKIYKPKIKKASPAPEPKVVTVPVVVPTPAAQTKIQEVPQKVEATKPVNTTPETEIKKEKSKIDNSKEIEALKKSEIKSTTLIKTPKPEIVEEVKPQPQTEIRKTNNSAPPKFVIGTPQ